MGIVSRGTVAGEAESCLIQEEPEAGPGFSHKMSLKGELGMLVYPWVERTLPAHPRRLILIAGLNRSDER